MKGGGFSDPLLKKLFDALPFYMMLVDEEHNILLANRAISRDLGVVPEKVVGGYCPKVVHNMDEPYPGCPLEEAVEMGHRTVEKELYNEDFGRWVKSAVYPTELRTEEGKVVYVHMVFDITERKRAEERLREYAAKLERSNKLKDLFIDIMTHDLLNMISIMRSMEELLLKRCESLRESREFGAITESTERLISLIQNASKLARLESLESISLEQRDLCELARVVVSTMKPQIEERRVRVVLRCCENAVAEVNPCIEEVFSNLISNAVKFSPEGAEVAVELVDEGEHLRICVRDSGPGVPDEYKEEIFNRFRRLEGKGSGRGLGLAIVRRIVELHSGEVWVEDNTPRGAVFNVRIPRRSKRRREPRGGGR
ncbi:MAG: PAS domain-containing sensor histidine kinase [Euryarchaeota archaeon]|nr:PAS domain-containing sensor histidine kinase [Euryarchaeota archaeon]